MKIYTFDPRIRNHAFYSVSFWRDVKNIACVSRLTFPVIMVFKTFSDAPLSNEILEKLKNERLKREAEISFHLFSFDS